MSPLLILQNDPHPLHCADAEMTSCLGAYIMGEVIIRVNIYRTIVHGMQIQS